MKTLIAGAVALSVLASAGIANAAPARHAQPAHAQPSHNNFERDHRADHRYQAGRYQAPRGYKARNFHRGQQLPQAYRGRGYVVDHNRYGLRAPPRGYQYVRVNNDVALTAITTGLIVSVISQLFN